MTRFLTRIYYIRLCALNLRRLVCRMTSFQFTTMSIPTVEKDQSYSEKHGGARGCGTRRSREGRN
jgi:hypothetical protein